MAVESATSLRLDAEIGARVQRLAEARHRSSDSIVKEAVEEYVTRAERREEFLRTGVAAREHYRATGLHVTGAEMDEWMERIEAGEDAAIPECHV